MPFVFDMCGFMSDTSAGQRLLVSSRGQRHQAKTRSEDDVKSELVTAFDRYCAGKFRRVGLLAHLQRDGSVRQALQFARSLTSIKSNGNSVQSSEIHS